jgi:hypothetical protein
MNPRARLFVAFVLFVGWLGWLAYAALSKSHAPTVSRAQAAAATHAVVADVRDGPEGKPAARVHVAEVLAGTGPAAQADLDVTNLPSAAGFDGPGEYLLLLVHTSGGFAVVGQQRSPGYDLANVGPPRIYRWSGDVQAQAKKLFP